MSPTITKASSGLSSCSPPRISCTAVVSDSGGSSVYPYLESLDGVGERNVATLLASENVGDLGDPVRKRGDPLD
jgi:hypothetical protein